MSEMNEYSDIEKTRLIHNKTVEIKKKKMYNTEANKIFRKFAK